MKPSFPSGGGGGGGDMFGDHLCMKMKGQITTEQKEKKNLLRLSDRSGRIEDGPFSKADSIRSKTPFNRKSLCSANLSQGVSETWWGDVFSHCNPRTSAPQSKVPGGSSQRSTHCNMTSGLRAWSPQPQCWESLSCGNCQTLQIPCTHQP